MAIAIYENTVLRGLNKVGKLKTDDNGYREITLGAFDYSNYSGEFYAFTAGLKSMFSPGSAFHRRMLRGALRGEVEHPTFRPGASFAEIMNRARTIRMDKVSSHHKMVRLEKSKDHTGRDIILCIGLTKGSGPHGDSLEKAFDNPEENVAFSVRSLTKPIVVRGKVAKEVTTLITYDQVNEGGIDLATKYETPSMESICDNIEFTDMQLAVAESQSSQGINALGFESASQLNYTMIRDSLGWNKVELILPRSSVDW